MTALTVPLGSPSTSQKTIWTGRSIIPRSSPCLNTSLIGSAVLSYDTHSPLGRPREGTRPAHNLIFVPQATDQPARRQSVRCSGLLAQICIDHLEEPGGHDRVVGQRSGDRGTAGVSQAQALRRESAGRDQYASRGHLA